MFTVKSSSEFIADIRAIDEKLNNIRLSNVEIERKQGVIIYNFICDNYIDETLKNLILKEAGKISASSFAMVKINVKKISNDSELIKQDLFKYLSETYPSISIFLKLDDIIVNVENSLVKYTLMLTKEGIDYVNKNGIIKKINDFLSRKYCADFSGTTGEKQGVETVDLLSEEVFESELQRIEHRTIKVSDVVCIDDFPGEDTAIYIEDALSGAVTICGTITDIAEKKTKTDKPFYIIHLDDTTGKTSGVYFTKKNTLHKIQELKVGDAIIVRGRIEEYNGKRSFVFDKINRCTFPKDFVKKEKFKKSAPKDYKLIFPTPATTIKEVTVFDEVSSLPQELIDNVYVVFDTETTGTDTLKDGLTEIGAVKIVGGKVVEQFTTLINPDHVISEEITKLTGIDFSMVKDSPRISAVLPDFLHFIDGAIVVAQNADFDIGFIKRFCNSCEYEFKNKIMDTMVMFRELVPGQRSANLHTIAEYFNITFHHHRALSDAYATAEAFIELMKIKAKKQ